jgi:hypothetical protein
VTSGVGDMETQRFGCALRVEPAVLLADDAGATVGVGECLRDGSATFDDPCW